MRFKSPLRGDTQTLLRDTQQPSWQSRSGTPVSTKTQITNRQQTDLLAASVRRDDLYIDHGVSGARASRPQFDAAINALHDGDTLVVTTLDRLGRSTANLLAV